MRTPRDILLSVEDNIDHPPHVIHPVLADKALEALAAEGYVIVPREPSREMIDSCPEEDALHIWRDMINVALGASDGDGPASKRSQA